jgi:hypothetical protein
MQELDMSRPGTELFPETANQQYNSYQDVNVDQVVSDPLDTGVKTTLDDAGQGQLSDKEMNFRALREETAKAISEREYWKGQAEAYSRIPQRPEPSQASQQDALTALDWDDGRDVHKAFDVLRQENQSLRSEIKDALTALTTKTQRQDWDRMVTEHVPQLTSKNPIFAEMIQKASNPYEAAYLLAELNARSQPAAQQPPPNYTSGNAQRALQNSQKPQTLASIGGGGTLSSADYYANMSDEDFMKIAGRNLANI